MSIMKIMNACAQTPSIAASITPALHVEHLSKVFNDMTALSSIDFSLQKGEILALLGPSGWGKTTLLRCIAGLLEVIMCSLKPASNVWQRSIWCLHVIIFQLWDRQSRNWTWFSMMKTLTKHAMQIFWKTSVIFLHPDNKLLYVCTAN